MAARLDDSRDRLTHAALEDVDAGRVIDHQTVQAEWAILRMRTIAREIVAQSAEPEAKSITSP